MRVHATIFLSWSTILYSTVTFEPTGAMDGIVTANVNLASVLAGTGHFALTKFKHTFDNLPNGNGIHMPSDWARTLALKSVASVSVLKVNSILDWTLRFTAQYSSLQWSILTPTGSFSPSPKVNSI